MSTDDRDDPGADTAMFRAYVDQPAEADTIPTANRSLAVAVVVALVVIAALGILLLVAA